MSSSAKRRQTMAKVTRERLVKERRAKKQLRKQEKKQAAQDAVSGTPYGDETESSEASEPTPPADES